MKPSLRFEVFKRDTFTCRYCGRKTPEAILEIDHVLPVSSGGTDGLENLVTSCYECNRGKGARLLTDVPAESDLHEKAVLIAEQERQIAELNHWRAKQRKREDGELDTLERKWAWGDRYWKRSDVRKFLRTLGFAEVLDALEVVNEKTVLQENKGWESSAWTFFCGICWGRIKGGG